MRTNIIKRSIIKIYTRYKLWQLPKKIVKFEPVSVSNKAILRCDYGGYIEIGTNTVIFEYSMLLTYGGNIVIGKRCTVNPYTIIYGHGGVKIGDDVQIAAQCAIIPTNHKYEDISMPISKQGNVSLGIAIEDNVWVGCGVKILDGVRIGTGSVIGAGSVVTHDVDPFSVVAGVPARMIKKR